LRRFERVSLKKPSDMQKLPLPMPGMTSRWLCTQASFVFNVPQSNALRHDFLSALCCLILIIAAGKVAANGGTLAETMEENQN